MESDFKKAERTYFEARDRKADSEIAQAQKTLDLDAARNTLRDLAATTKTIAGEALEDTRSYTVNPKAKPMRLADKDERLTSVMRRSSTPRPQTSTSTRSTSTSRTR
ncbi:MAG: hypothetical protein R2843_08615 [Thermomicrobiales bacterium]